MARRALHQRGAGLIGAGSLGRNDGKVALYFREDIHLAGPPPGNAKLEAPQGDVHDAIRHRLESGPSFWLDLLQIDATAEELHEALWDLAWNGEVTNDAFAPLRAPRLRAAGGPPRGGRRFSQRRAAASATVLGRWSLTSALFDGAPSQGPRSRAQAELMLERHGIVTRETAIAEGIPGGFAAIYGELTNLELLGTARRGYFVEGLGGAQFALPGAVERLRSLPRSDGSMQILAATDPANPYGATLPWPKREGSRRPARTANAYVALRDGVPLLYVERGGRGILRLAPLVGEELGSALEELSAAARDGVIEKLAIERLDGEPVIGTPAEQLLVDAGFRRQPRRLVA